MRESILQMQMRHAQEMAALIEEIRTEAYEAGLYDRMKPGTNNTPKSEMEVITEKIAADYNVLPSELRGANRFSHFTEPRRVIWKTLNDKGHSLPAIGRFFGRHHTTILNGINELEGLS